MVDFALSGFGFVAVALFIVTALTQAQKRLFSIKHTFTSCYPVNLSYFYPLKVHIHNVLSKSTTFCVLKDFYVFHNLIFMEKTTVGQG